MESRTGIHKTRCAVHGSAGFTLVELMITVLVAAILMGLGIPMLRSLMANNALSGQTNDMIAAIVWLNA